MLSLTWVVAEIPIYILSNTTDTTTTAHGEKSAVLENENKGIEPGNPDSLWDRYRGQQLKSTKMPPAEIVASNYAQKMVKNYIFTSPLSPLVLRVKDVWLLIGSRILSLLSQF